MHDNLPVHTFVGTPTESPFQANGLGQVTVWQDDEVVRGVQQVGGAPVGLDHAALDAVVQHDPVADLVGVAEIEGNAGEDVAQACSAARDPG